MFNRISNILSPMLLFSMCITMYTSQRLFASSKYQSVICQKLHPNISQSFVKSKRPQPGVDKHGEQRYGTFAVTHPVKDCLSIVDLNDSAEPLFLSIHLLY